VGMWKDWGSGMCGDSSERAEKATVGGVTVSSSVTCLVSTVEKWKGQ
jgi:hypothetical protein